MTVPGYVDGNNSSFNVESNVLLTSVGSDVVSGLLDESLVPALVVWCCNISLDTLFGDCAQFVSLDVLVLKALATLPPAPLLLLLFVLDAEECAGEFKSLVDWAMFNKQTILMLYI